MKIAGGLRSLFSPYELAAGGIVGAYICFGALLLLMVRGGSAIGLVALGFIFATLQGAAWLLGRCPNCGKSALKLYLRNREQGLGQILFIGRFWPERVCSSCRTPLDVI